MNGTRVDFYELQATATVCTSPNITERKQNETQITGASIAMQPAEETQFHMAGPGLNVFRTRGGLKIVHVQQPANCRATGSGSKTNLERRGVIEIRQPMNEYRIKQLK